MEPEHGLSRGSAALIVLAIVWFFGTLSLGYAALYYGLVIGTGPSRDGDLAHTLIYAALALGIGAPVVGLVIAIRLHHKAGTWVYGLIVLGLAVLGVSALSGQRDSRAYTEGQAICAPPELELDVPGC